MELRKAEVQLRRTPLLGRTVNNLRSCFTFITVRYTAGSITIGKGGRGSAADGEEGKPRRRDFESRATRVALELSCLAWLSSPSCSCS